MVVVVVAIIIVAAEHKTYNINSQIIHIHLGLESSAVGSVAAQHSTVPIPTTPPLTTVCVFIFSFNQEYNNDYLD